MIEEIKVNGNIYTNAQYQKDLVRYFDAIRDKDHQGDKKCAGVKCNECIFLANKKLKKDDACTGIGPVFSMENVIRIYEWAKAHPVITNRDKLKEVFNVELTKEYELFLSYMRPTPNPYGDPFYYFGEEWINKSIEEWLDEEWKDPKQKLTKEAKKEKK